jgi:peptidoglycan/xylan/chitin deacetylase (PgdA/CDA1 family)
LLTRRSIVDGRPDNLTGCDCDALDADGWDVASHGYTHDDPTQMTPEQLTFHLLDAQLWLLGRGYARGARHYAPPSGHCNQEVLDAALLYYDTVWNSQYGQLPPGYDYTTLSCNNNYDWETELRPRLERLVGHPTRVARCTFHVVVLENPGYQQTDLARLNTILDYLQAQQINVLTLSDLLDGSQRQTSTLAPPRVNHGRR